MLPSETIDAVIRRYVPEVQIFASADCSEDGLSWILILDHFNDGFIYNIDAIFESFEGIDRPPTSAYASGAFSIRVPEGLDALITEGQDGTGDFRVVKGRGYGEC